MELEVQAVKPVFAFTQSLVDRLQASVQQNMGLYVKTKRPWVCEVADDKEWNLQTPYEFKEDPVLKFKARRAAAKQDLTSAKALHRALALSRTDASDPRLWTRLAHVDFWTYMQVRWPVKPGAVDFVHTRYFVKGHGSRGLLRNGIARLWWLAELTYDPERDNPYELTDVLFADLDLAAQLSERNFGRAENIMKSFLEFLRQRRDVLLVGGELNRMRIRKLAIYVNQIGGATVLDLLSQPELHRLFDGQLRLIMDGERRSGTVRSA